jgi:hypothetical protein
MDSPKDGYPKYIFFINNKEYNGKNNIDYTSKPIRIIN